MGGAFCKKVENGGCFFVKKVDLSSTHGVLCSISITVYYSILQYQYFLFYILLIWGGGAYAPNAPPAYVATMFFK